MPPDLHAYHINLVPGLVDREAAALLGLDQKKFTGDNQFIQSFTSSKSYAAEAIYLFVYVTRHCH